VSPEVVLIAAAAGYLVGSIPFAVVVVRSFGGGRRLGPAALPVPGTDDVLITDAVSATTVRLQLGARYGCMTSLLDMAKASAVTLAFKLAYPDTPYFLVASGLAVVGHIWPIFNRFRGGRGQSPIIGSLFVVDWPTALIAYPTAQLLGLATGFRAYVARFAPMLVAAGWLYMRFADLSFVLYALGLFAVRIVASRPEIREYARIRKAGGLRSLSEELELLKLRETLTQGIARVRRWARRGRTDRGS
jgi:acyl phosphate:glycerol-3-phosphate acyltransferase